MKRYSALLPLTLLLHSFAISATITTNVHGSTMADFILQSIILLIATTFNAIIILIFPFIALYIVAGKSKSKLVFKKYALAWLAYFVLRTIFMAFAYGLWIDLESIYDITNHSMPFVVDSVMYAIFILISYAVSTKKSSNAIIEINSIALLINLCYFSYPYFV